MSETNKKKWIEASELPEHEKVYLKKDIFGYYIVHPYKNEDGSINWFNLITGGKRSLFFWTVVALMIAWHLWEDNKNLESVINQYELLRNYSNISFGGTQLITNFTINVTG